MRNQPDQLDVQCHVERKAIRLSFAKARRRVADWAPAPLPARGGR